MLARYLIQAMFVVGELVPLEYWDMEIHLRLEIMKLQTLLEMLLSGEMS